MTVEAILACAHGCHEGMLTKSFPGGYCPICRAYSEEALEKAVFLKDASIDILCALIKGRQVMLSAEEIVTLGLRLYEQVEKVVYEKNPPAVTG